MPEGTGTTAATTAGTTAGTTTGATTTGTAPEAPVSVPPTRNLYPADAVLNLPVGRHSAGLARLAAVEAARGSFADAREAIERATGVRLGKRQVGGTGPHGRGGHRGVLRRPPAPCRARAGSWACRPTARAS